MTPTAANLGVDIIQGAVARASSHLSGGTIYRDQTSATIHSTPEIWLRDETGREHHFRGPAFDGIREGHTLIVVCDAAKGTLLRIANRDTRATTDRGAIIPDRSGWAVIRAVLWKVVTIYLPIAFFGAHIGRETGLSDTNLAPVFGIATNILLLYCGYLGWREAREKAEKVVERRAALNELFRQNGWINENAA